MHSEARELYQFMSQIMKTPLDLTTRLVFADWLDQHDEPELANEQREFCSEGHQKKLAAEARLREIAKEFAGNDYEGMIKGVLQGHYCFSHDDYCEIDWKQMCDDIELVTSKQAGEASRDTGNFRCAC